MSKFGKKNGYSTYVSPATGKEKFVHIRVMEKKLGGKVAPGKVVHHINGVKTDNRPANLVAVTRGVHGRIHGNTPNACFKCGRASHGAAACYAKTDYAKKPIK